MRQRLVVLIDNLYELFLNQNTKSSNRKSSHANTKL